MYTFSHCYNLFVLIHNFVYQMSHMSSHICLPPFPNTDIPAYSDSAGTLKKCHCKRGASYCVTVSRHFYCMKVEGSEKCFCKRGASYCITESRVTVSGKPCMMYHLTHIECIPVSHKYVGYAARGRGAEREGRGGQTAVYLILITLYRARLSLRNFAAIACN